METFGEPNGSQAGDERDNEREDSESAHGRVHCERVVLAKSERLKFVEFSSILNLFDGCDHQIEAQDGHDQ